MAENNFITVSTYSTVSLCLRRDPTGSIATEGWQAAGWRGVKWGEEEGGCRWVGQRVTELMTVLSAVAERAEMDGASVFSCTLHRPKSPWAKQNRKRGASRWIQTVCWGNGWLMLSLTTQTHVIYCTTLSQLLLFDLATRCPLAGLPFPVKTKGEISIKGMKYTHHHIHLSRLCLNGDNTTAGHYSHLYQEHHHCLALPERQSQSRKEKRLSEL